jgi:hypothetical protein
MPDHSDLTSRDLKNEVLLDGIKTSETNAEEDLGIHPRPQD